jgi:hypothetical protein
MTTASGMKRAGHVACMGENRNPYKVVVGKPEGKRPRSTG